MTEDQFITKEIATWGEDYIFSLIDAGYKPVAFTTSSDNLDEIKWSWVLTQPYAGGTMRYGGNSAFTPVSLGSRL